MEGICAGASNTVIDAVTISTNAIILAVEPAAYRHVEGADVSKQAHIQDALRTRKPVMSQVFKTVEGVDAVDIEHPVLAADGVCAGTVSVIFRPSDLIGRIAAGAVAGMPVELWAMQPDGRILYDIEAGKVGRMLFSDPLYKQYGAMLRLGRWIAAEPEGYGSYTFLQAGTTDPVVKDAWWVSAGLHGAEWRLVMTHRAGEKARG